MILAAILSLAIGIVLGLLGGGGAILTLPMLVYVVHMAPKPAIATSLFVVGSTSLVATVVNARARTVEWRTGLVFGAAAMVSAFAGGHLASFVPATALLLAFAVTMLLTSLAMLRGRAAPAQSGGDLALAGTLALGSGVGLLSGLVGAGGGFLIVPALALFGRLPMQRAIATSLLVIALQSFAGFAGHVGHAALDWNVIGIVTAMSVIGMAFGTYASRMVPADALRRSFAWLVLGMGIFVIAKQTSGGVTVFVTAIAAAGALIVTRSRPSLAK